MYTIEQYMFDYEYFIFYQVIMVASLLVSLYVIALAWQRREIIGARAIVALGAATLVWALGYFLEAHSVTLESQLFFTRVGYVGLVTVPVAWVIFAINYGYNRRIINIKRALLFCIIPVISLILVWTNDWHHLVWTNEHLGTTGLFIITVKNYKPLFWVAVSYSHLLMLSGIFIIVHRLLTSRPPMYMKQLAVLLIAVGLPLLFNIIYVLDLFDLPRKDLSPALVAFSWIAIIFGMMRFRILEIVPFARKFVIEQIQDGMLVFDMEFRLLEANKAALNILGIGRDVIGKKMEELPEVTASLKKLSGENDPLLSIDPSSVSYDYEVRTLKVNDNKGLQVGWLILLHDVTERRKRELEYKALTQTTAEGFCLVDMNGRFIDVNETYCRLVGYTREEILAKKLGDIESIYTPASLAARLKQMRIFGSDRFHSVLKRKDGSLVEVEYSVNYLNIDNGRIFAFVHDLSEKAEVEHERRELEKKAQTASRLATIGELAAGISHEINNPLTSVIGYSQLLIERDDVPADIRNDLTAINDAAQRVADIVRRLLSFARNVKPERTNVNINELIINTLNLRSYHLKMNQIEVETELEPDLPLTVADKGQIQQVLLNLIINAETEMKLAHGKGKLTIRTEKDGNIIRIYVIDDGPGIKQEIMDKIFEPFFTTREAGQGTGLGLSLCYGIVTAHNGRIYAQSEYGKGATFIVELPVESAVAVPQTSKSSADSEKSRLKAKILVVDDEKMVLRYISRLLTSEGYVVSTASNADSAKKKIKENRYNLILLDIKMPDIDGIELYRYISSIADSLARRVIFITGDVMNDEAQKFFRENDVPYITKPFDASYFREFVRKYLMKNQ